MKPILGTCQKCGRLIWMGDINGVRAAVDLAPVDAQQAVDAIVTRRQLVTPNASADGTPRSWTVHRGALDPARPVYAEHPCGSTAGYRPLPAPRTPVDPPVPSAGPSTPSWGSQTADSSLGTARGAEPRRTDPPADCHECGRPIEGARVAISLGTVVVWVAHVDRCPAD